MKKYILLPLLFFSAFLVAQKISVDEAATTITFNFLDDNVDGTLEGFQFTGNLDLNNLQGSTISGSVDTKTIDTNNWLRSRHLRSGKYFDASDFPKLKFSSTAINGNLTSFTVTGTLEIKGIEKNVTWVFKNSNNKLIGTAHINTQDYDISIHDIREENEVKITLKMPYK